MKLKLGKFYMNKMEDVCQIIAKDKHTGQYLAEYEIESDGVIYSTEMWYNKVGLPVEAVSNLYELITEVI